MARTPLPPQLHGNAIRVTDAPRHGVGEQRLRARDVQRPFHGVASLGLDLEDVADRSRAFAPLLEPGQAFSHTTALALHGLPLPSSASAIHLSVLFPRTPPRGRGVVGHALKSLPTGRIASLPVVAPVEAWCQSAAVLRREDLVAVGDALCTGPRRDGIRGPARATGEELRDAVAGWRGRPGAGRLRWALPRIRAGVDSRPETLVRLALVAGGLPEPEVDLDVGLRDRTLHADLGYPDARIAIEYEGDGHRVDRRRWMGDIDRRESMEDAGWRVIRVTAAQLFPDPGPLVARVAARLAERRR